MKLVSPNSNASRCVFSANPRYRTLVYPKRRFTYRNGCSTLALMDAFRLSSTAASLPGSNCRRLLGLMATRHSTSNPLFSSLLATPLLPRISPHPFLPSMQQPVRLRHVMHVGGRGAHAMHHSRL